MRALLDYLAEQHFSNDTQGLAVSRQRLDDWAGQVARGDGTQAEIKFLDHGNNLRVRDVLEPMDPAQAQRFIDELFLDIVPHLSSQRQFMADLMAGATHSGAKVDNPMFEHLRRMGVSAQDLPDNLEEILAGIQTQVQELTWVDDQARTITTRVDVEIHESLEGLNTNERKLKF
jgi:hypothetical protein